jgi:large subunit ribosomal protein L23
MKKTDTKKTPVALDVTKILKNPRITEKAAHLSGNGVYTFDITTTTTKPMIKKAIEQVYKVVPVKVTVSTIIAKKVFRKGGWGVKKGGRKAMVFLKKGDKIEFV